MKRPNMHSKPLSGARVDSYHPADYNHNQYADDLNKYIDFLEKELYFKKATVTHKFPTPQTTLTVAEDITIYPLYAQIESRAVITRNEPYTLVKGSKIDIGEVRVKTQTPHGTNGWTPHSGVLVYLNDGKLPGTKNVRPRMSLSLVEFEKIKFIK